MRTLPSKKETHRLRVSVCQTPQPGPAGVGEGDRVREVGEEAEDTGGGRGRGRGGRRRGRGRGRGQRCWLHGKEEEEGANLWPAVMSWGEHMRGTENGADEPRRKEKEFIKAKAEGGPSAGDGGGSV